MPRQLETTLREPSRADAGMRMMVLTRCGVRDVVVWHEHHLGEGEVFQRHGSGLVL